MGKTLIHREGVEKLLDMCPEKVSTVKIVSTSDGKFKLMVDAEEILYITDQPEMQVSRMMRNMRSRSHLIHKDEYLERKVELAPSQV